MSAGKGTGTYDVLGHLPKIDYGHRPVSEQLDAEQGGPVPAPLSISDTLEARGARYGVFTGHAEITQKLKFVIEHQLTKRNKALAHDQKEALDMICHKIGRIVNGDADYDDSWVDIAGYAQLVVDRLRGKPR